MEFMDYIIGDALILIPALYILGMIAVSYTHLRAHET